MFLTDRINTFYLFYESFYGLEAHIHSDFHLKKCTSIINFVPDKIKEFYEEQFELN